ncbi:auxin efflux carrier [Saccharata proteae CBS 121410]|uniref:Auxin efflux carrier n=1 Tax=Saccharata proteae CBS 121410 TaxID=1314787 RepID=A0A9P4HND9_9PEZI|nr:auxin efflux carrier [Saccharata proteae CBS 121410]
MQVQNDFASLSAMQSSFSDNAVMDALTKGAHASHPDFGHLCLLVFEAVMEVVCVSLPGYIVARQGMFDANAQKFVANLNVQLFTPCLIFTKLASQLTADKLVDLAIIPAIFVVQTLVSWGCSLLVSRLFGFKKQRPQNFVTAMAVFGNSNSLPISLVLSLSKTISGLHWDQIPGDNDNDVGARGILYLLIFQQLGQLVRWSWGYQVLLKPASEYKDEDAGRAAALEQGNEEEQRNLLDNNSEDGSPRDRREDPFADHSSSTESEFESGSATPVTNGAVLPTPANGNAVFKGPGNLAGRTDSTQDTPQPKPQRLDFPSGPKGWYPRAKWTISQKTSNCASAIRRASHSAFTKLPKPAQKVVATTGHYIARFFAGLWEFMNPPLWAMLVALIVASVPPLQHIFFTPGTFINNSVTRAVSQSGGVAVPLILVVLGANLARNTLPKESAQDIADSKDEKKLLYASLISRMLLPTVIMAPILAVVAKFAPVSIIADPIFMIVCFLLTGAPSALQLAQICQLNNVYMGAMSKLLFQSYVVWILPSTLVLVMLALETVEWANAGRA